MDIKGIAELVILQSIEDLWDRRERAASAKFLNGRGFDLCAGLAGIGPAERRKLLELLVKLPAARRRTRLQQHPVFLDNRVGHPVFSAES